MAVKHKARLKLVVPTDFEVLEVMSDGKRQTAPNLAALLGAKRQYMNDRTSQLSGKGLIEKVGPSQRSGMYVITPIGLAAIELREEYSHDTAAEWGERVRELAKEIRDS